MMSVFASPNYKFLKYILSKICTACETQLINLRLDMNFCHIKTMYNIGCITLTQRSLEVTRGHGLSKKVDGDEHFG